MDKVIKLRVGKFMLILRVVNSVNWCRVYFEDEKNRRMFFLGAEALEVIRSRLLFALKRENLDEKKKYKYGNIDLFWILSLSEKHACIYGHLPSDYEIILFCIEDGGNVLPEVYLKKCDIENWISIIERSVD